jgi:hypothetical protein
VKHACLLFAFLALAAGRAQSPQPAPPARGEPVPGDLAENAGGGSAQNWSMHVFSDAEGYRQMSVRGSEVHPAGPGEINVTDLSITIYSGDAAAHVETMLLSPTASFFTKVNRASGEKSVRVIRDDLEATGTRWTYDQAQKKVSLDGRVRIVFNAELKDLLK